MLAKLSKFLYKLYVPLLILILEICNYARAETLSVVTEAGSLQYAGENQVEGVATDLVRAVLSEAKISGHIRIYPWPRAYELAKTTPNTLIYSMARTPQREKYFKWIGEILPLDYQFFRLKSNTLINPTTLEQARQFNVGVINNGAIHNFLKRKEFNHITVLSNTTAHIKMFMSQRVDLIIANASRLQSLCKNTLLDCELIEPIIPIPEISSGLYMALSKSTNDDVHHRLVTAYKSIKEKGVYKEIMQTQENTP